MSAIVDVPTTKYYLGYLAARERVTCPKCRGLGSIVLMRRPLKPDAAEACPACDGVGTLVRRNGPEDYLPTSVGGQAR